VKRKKDEYEIKYSPFCSSLEKIINIHIIDSRTNLAVWEFIEPLESTGYGLFAPSDSVKLFPVIANYCKYELALEYKFEQPNYLRILREHKEFSQKRD
jgi:hypothetical protein